jgi:cell shape-determining protein MreD
VSAVPEIGYLIGRFSEATQAPDWVRARVLAVSMLVFQGAVAAGSATWGSAAAKISPPRLKPAFFYCPFVHCVLLNCQPPPSAL